MLTELYLENFALIEKLHVKLSNGLNVITGETGAGKSIIIDAVGLILGGRSSQDFIRMGAEKCVVQGVFTCSADSEIHNILSEMGLTDENDNLILSREIYKNSRNTCRVNFRVVPLSLYRDLGNKLINIHGQHEHVSLLEEQNQMLMLDGYGGQNLINLRNEVKKSYYSLSGLQKKIEKTLAQEKDIARRLDLLKYQIEEIESASLSSDEEEELFKERSLLQNAEKLASGTRNAYEKLYGSRQAGANDLISNAINDLKKLSNVDSNVETLLDKLNEIFYLLEDTTREIGIYAQNVVNNPDRLDDIEKRINMIKNLKRKYGNSISEILHFAEVSKEELYELEHQEQNIKNFEQALQIEQKKYTELAQKLTELRKNAAGELSRAVTKELNQLQMPHAKFEIGIFEAEIGPLGADGIVFLICPNPGEDFKPLARIASGGEMSRVMLGIKVILAKLDKIPTLIFDEIDSGLGGRAVYAVAEKLEAISCHNQVICVTHSPVVASFANNHLFISKETHDERTTTNIQKLDEKARVRELCRMLAGDNVTEITIAQANELLKTASYKKAQ